MICSNEKKFNVVKQAGQSGNYIVTIAIGESYYNKWKDNALPLWDKYCHKHGLGIIVFYDNLIPEYYPNWKKATWQKLLIGDVLLNSTYDVKNVCYLDTDILINPFAPNVFDELELENISVVSLKKNLPQPLDETLRREAFLRHTYYSSSYPLDSALFISLDNIYKHHNFPPQNDLFCAGMFMFNVHEYSSIMKDWFDKYPSDVNSITGGGDQTHLNFEFLSYGKIKWLDYRYQAIWVYEMAWKYPFLYNTKIASNELITECIEASLYSNYFLHFAGSWNESSMWELGGVFEEKNKIVEMQTYYEYLATAVTGEPKGMVKPK